VQESNNQIAEIKKQQVAKITPTPRNIAFIVMTVGGLLFAGAMAMQIITGILALVFSVIAGVGLFLGLRFLKAADPLIKQHTRNYLLSKMIDNAKKYKIETLTQLVLTSEERLKKARKARDKMGGYVGKLQGKLEEAAQDAPSYNRKVEMTEKVKQAYDLVVRNVERAGEAHKSLSLKVTDYKEMAEFSNVAAEAMEFASANSGNKLEEMLGMEAFATIENEFHEAMATIDNSVRDFELDEE